MTIGIAVACRDGLVMGADRKVVRTSGTSIKHLEDKIFPMSFKDGRPLLMCYSGGTDVALRAISLINPQQVGEDMDASKYRDAVEYQVALLNANLAQRGLVYDANLLYGMLDPNQVVIGRVTPSGLTETRQLGYFVTGIAAPYAELVLKDSYAPDMSYQDAKLIIAGLILKIGQVDNDVEGMDVYCVPLASRTIDPLSMAERQGIGQVPLDFDFKEELDDVKQAVASWTQLMEQYDATQGRNSEGQSATDNNGS